MRSPLPVLVNRLLLLRALLPSAVALAAVGTLMFAPASRAATSVTIVVNDASGHPVADAVVYAVPTSGQTLSKVPHEAIVDQIDKEFVPLVTPVQVGSAVRFPNKDNIRHQVYSFSPAKTFTLKLYSGVPAQPVVFDKPGEVVLGCNIHDHMVAYVFAVDTPFFSKSDARGEAHLALDAPGDFEIRVWHPYQKAAPAGQLVRNGAAATLLRATVELAPRQPAAHPDAPR